MSKDCTREIIVEANKSLKIIQITPIEVKVRKANKDDHVLLNDCKKTDAEQEGDDTKILVKILNPNNENKKLIVDEMGNFKTVTYEISDCSVDLTHRLGLYGE